MAVMIDKETKEFRPVTAFLNAERLAKDVARVNDAGRGKFLSVVGVALALLRSYDPLRSSEHVLNWRTCWRSSISASVPPDATTVR